MRAVLLGLMAVGVIGGAPPDSARGQNRAADAPGGAEASPARRAAASSSGTGRTAAEASKAAENAGVEASPLDTMWMRDSKGNLVPVVGIPFEEFEQLLRSKKGLAPSSPPAYTLETVSLVGKANERSADFQLTATIRVRESGWVRVPLHMPSAVIRQPLKHEGPGEHFLSYDADADGYVCWLNSNDTRPHVISVTLSLALTSVGEERRLAVALPRATESTLRLSVDAKTVDTSLASGEGIATSRALASGASEIAVVGAAGDLQLTWRPGRKVANNDLQLDASGEISVRIHSAHRIASDARLRVRSYGSPLESFRVRLPPGMELISTPAGIGYSLSAVDLEATGGPSNGTQRVQQMVEVRIDKPAANVEVLLRAQREADTAAATWFSPAQFEVLGAVRQRGNIDFAMDGEWQVDWKEDKSVHRIDLMPDTTAGRSVARYEYFQQPCGLSVKVSARPSRLSVEPIHRVFVGPERVRIESLLHYRFRGARAERLVFEMGDWVFDRLTPDLLFDFPLPNEAGSSELHLPFRPGAAPPTDLELKLEAHHVLPRGTEQLSLSFPRPRADIVVPATIMVFATENIELTPHYDLCQGLSSETVAQRPQEKEHPSLVFRDLGGEEVSRFVASLRTLKQSINTSAKATVRIDRQQFQVEQRIEYRVAHEPQREFVLIAPMEVASSDSLDVLVNGESVPTRQILDSEAGGGRLVRLQFTTLQAIVGNFQAVIRYTLPLTWDRNAAFGMTLPLVLPADDGEGSFSGQQVQFQLADDVNIEPEQIAIEDAVQPLPVRGAVNTYSWEGVANFSQWSLVPGRGAASETVQVSQMWIQTWLTSQVRYERVALRVSTNRDNLRLRLPGAVRGNIQAAVDSERIEPGRRLERQSAPEIVIPLKNRGQEYVLEVWYSLDPPPRWLGVCQGELRSVQIPDAEAPRRSYWQLVTSPGERLIAMPETLSAEMVWSSDRFHISRKPILDQRQLESWIKSSRQDPLPYSPHEYLFGSVARWPTFRFAVARTSMIVGSASAAIMLIGLSLIYVQALRRPEIFLGLAVALGGVCLVWPDTAILVAQAGSLGLALCLCIALWNFVMAVRTNRGVWSTSASASQSLSAPSSHFGGSRRDMSSQISTTRHTPLIEARP